MAYNKYYLQKRQVSYDNGLTWEDVTPSETRQGAYIYSYETLAECEGDYSSQYLTFESLDDNNAIYLKAVSNTNVTISASTDNGSTWTAYTSTTGGSGTTIATLNTGDKVLIKGTNQAYTNNRFNSSGQFNAYGNIMSLLYGDNFSGQTALTDNYLFQGLFQDSNIISAENLIIPATTLTDGCYLYMFAGCTNLTTAPNLPALNLAVSCYHYMFWRCTSLVNAPELSALNLVRLCYALMFAGCTNLNSITCLATDKSAESCTYNWVNNVSATGTFVKDANTTWTTGISGIPSGWTVQNNS